MLGGSALAALDARLGRFRYLVSIHQKERPWPVELSVVHIAVVQLGLGLILVLTTSA
jgi:hypothetical protein